MTLVFQLVVVVVLRAMIDRDRVRKEVVLALALAGAVEGVRARLLGKRSGAGEGCGLSGRMLHWEVMAIGKMSPPVVVVVVVVVVR